MRKKIINNLGNSDEAVEKLYECYIYNCDITKVDSNNLENTRPIITCEIVNNDSGDEPANYGAWGKVRGWLNAIEISRVSLLIISRTRAMDSESGKHPTHLAHLAPKLPAPTSQQNWSQERHGRGVFRLSYPYRGR